MELVLVIKLSNLLRQFWARIAINGQNGWSWSQKRKEGVKKQANNDEQDVCRPYPA